MKDNKAWYTHFNISSKHSSYTLREALQKELLQQEDYQRWASYYYNMPVLKAQYFKDSPRLNQKLWKKHPHLWNESLLPVLEWENIIYVASLEPHKIQIDQKVVFLLTHTQCLENLWKQTLSTSQFSQKETSHKTSSLKSFNKKTESYHKKHISNDEEIVIESSFLSGLWAIFLEKLLFITQIVLSKPSQSPERKKEPTSDHIEEKRNQMNQNVQSNSLEAHINPKKIKSIKISAHSTPNLSNMDILEEPTSKKHPASRNTTPLVIGSDLDTSTDELKPALDPKIATEDSKKEKTIALVQEHEEPFQEEKKSSSSLVSQEDSKPESPGSSVKENVNALFTKKVTQTQNNKPELSTLRKQLEETRKHIDFYILFLFKKDQFIPCKWSANLKPTKKVSGTIKSPSIFRICYTSKQPYCGKIAPVINNNYFFENWGFETLPSYSVFIPFLNENKKVMGGYLGISKDHMYSINFLKFIEKIVKPFSTFYNDPKLLKKAS